MEIKVSEVKMVKCYVATLREFDLGETKYYQPIATDYNGFHNARKRLEERNVAKFTLSWSNDKKYLKVTRDE